MAFTNEQLERYSRHIILKEVGAKGQKKLLNSSVLIIGAGGLGAPAVFSPDGGGKLPGQPRPAAGAEPEAGHRRGGEHPVFCGEGGGYGPAYPRRDRLHDPGADPVRDGTGGGS